MPDLDIKTTSKSDAPKVATPTTAPPEEKAKLLEKERISEEEAKKQRAYIKKTQREGKAKNKVKAGLAKVGLDSEIGDSDDDDDELEKEFASSRGGMAKFADAADGFVAVDEEKGSDTEGLSLGVSKDGIQAGGIDLADGWSGDFALGPGQQKAEFKAPTGLKFPPPDGFELDLLKIPIPLGPGFGIDITAGLEGKLEIDDVGLALEHRNATTGIQQVDRFAVTGKGGFSGEFGIKLEVAMWGGVPVVASVRAGIRALAEAAAKLEFEAGGRLDVSRTVPVLGETQKVTSKDGEIYLNLVGTGELTAALSAFLGYELFTFKGDLYELVIAKATLANFELGGRFGVRYDDGKRAFFAEPIERDYASFDWLFGKLWKARKLDMAKAKATETKADLAALEDLKSRPDLDEYLQTLEKDGAFLHTGNGELQLLVNEEQTLTDLINADQKAIAATEAEIRGPLLRRNEETKKQRWAITNFFRGDIPELDEARDAVKTMNKNLTDNLAKVSQIAEKKKAAQKKFLESLDPATLDARIEAAKAKADETYRENWKTFKGEVADSKKTLHKQWTDLDDEIEKQDALIQGIAMRLASGSAGLMDLFQKQQDAAQLEETLKESQVTALVERVDRITAQRDKLGPVDLKGKKGAELAKELAKVEAEQKKAIAAWEQAHKSRVAVAKNNPVAALEDQLAKAQAHKMLLEKRRAKLLADAADDHLEQRKLLHGSGVVKPRPDSKAAVGQAATAFKKRLKKDEPPAA